MNACDEFVTWLIIPFKKTKNNFNNNCMTVFI